MESNGPDWGLLENFRLSDVDFVRSNFSKLLVLVLRRLDGAYPNRVELTDCWQVAENGDEIDRLWSWLSAQRIVTGEISDCSLTVSGRQAFRAAPEELQELAIMLMKSIDGLEEGDASRMLLAVLRIHYLRFGQQ